MRGFGWSLHPHLCGAATLAVLSLAGAMTGAARADGPGPGGPAPAERPKPLRSPSNLDGLYFTIGPVGAVTKVQGDWYTSAGAEASFVYLREKCIPAAVGIDAGGISFAGRDGGRIWAEVEVALNRPLPFAVGIAAGPVAEVAPNDPTHLGWQAGLWIFAGVIPYVRAGTVEQDGGFVEIGLMIKIPARRLF